MLAIRRNKKELVGGGSPLWGPWLVRLDRERGPWRAKGRVVGGRRGTAFEVWSGQLLFSLITRGKRREGETERRRGEPGGEGRGGGTGEGGEARGRKSNCPASLRHCPGEQRAERAGESRQV